MIPPPRWTGEQLARGIAAAVEIFRQQRMEEPLAAYLNAFGRYEHSILALLEKSSNLVELESKAAEVLAAPGLLEALRYLSGPPLSEDDLKTLADAALSPSRLRADPAMATRVVRVIRMGLDGRRFPWVAEGRDPRPSEKSAAVLASAVLMATRSVGTSRRNEGKEAQEMKVAETLRAARE